MEHQLSFQSENNNISYLILDDDGPFGLKLKDLIEKKGYPCFYVSGIKEAIKIISTNNIQRVILDLKLSNESGLSFLEYLNSTNSIKDTEVCILTGYGSVETVKHALFKGAKNYLQKPCSLESILNSFENNLIEKSYPLPTLDDLEKDHINRVLTEQKGNISKSAKILGMHRRSLQRKLKK